MQSSVDQFASLVLHERDNNLAQLPASHNLINPMDQSINDKIPIGNVIGKADALRVNDLNNNLDEQTASKMDVMKQLEKWNRVRESLYSQSGWSSENVNQNSKWDVEIPQAEVAAAPMGRSEAVLTGTNQWGNSFAPADGRNFGDISPSRNWPDSVEAERARGGAIPRPTRSQFEVQSRPPNLSPLNLHRGAEQPADWKTIGPISPQMNKAPRPITKAQPKSFDSPIPGDPMNSMNSYFQQMNVQSNAQPYQPLYGIQQNLSALGAIYGQQPFDGGITGSNQIPFGQDTDSVFAAPEPNTHFSPPSSVWPPPPAPMQDRLWEAPQAQLPFESFDFLDSQAANSNPFYSAPNSAAINQGSAPWKSPFNQNYW